MKRGTAYSGDSLQSYEINIEYNTITKEKETVKCQTHTQRKETEATTIVSVDTSLSLKGKTTLIVRKHPRSVSSKGSNHHAIPVGGVVDVVLLVETASREEKDGW